VDSNASLTVIPLPIARGVVTHNFMSDSFGSAQSGACYHAERKWECSPLVTHLWFQTSP